MTREEAVGNLKYSIRWNDMPKKEALDMAIKALRQEPCEDCISREDALLALTGEWTELTDKIIHRFIKRMKSLPSVKPTEKEKQESCDDAISRQAALNSLINNTHLDGYDLAEAIDAIENKEKLPSVTPQPKMGHWIHFSRGSDCSECGWNTGKYMSPSKYCPDCGIKMVESQTESEEV